MQRAVVVVSIGVGLMFSTMAMAMWGQGGMFVAPGAVPVAVALSPSSSTLPDNTPAGTVISTVTITMSDNSAFHGSLTSNRSLFAISGMNVIAARNFTAGDDGLSQTTITAAP